MRSSSSPSAEGVVCGAPGQSAVEFPRPLFHEASEVTEIAQKSQENP
jgi:hypothetical protein